MHLTWTIALPLLVAACATQPTPTAPTAEACTEVGEASWYQGSSKGRSSPSEPVAAHKTLPLGSTVRVTTLDTGRSVDVRINDRGPFGKGRVIDVSKSAADALGIRRDGVAKVQLSVDGAESGCPLQEARLADG